MVVEVSNQDLGALMNALSRAPARAVTLWRGMMELHSTKPCSACQYDLLIGRKCCCLCLESNLLHAWFAVPSGERMRAAHEMVKAHREAACASCSPAPRAPERSPG